MLASVWTNYEVNQFSILQKNSWQNFKVALVYVRPERINKLPNCMIDMMIVIMMNISKDVPHEIRNINLTNAVIFRSFTVEGTLSGQNSCHLKCNFCPQAGVAPVTQI